MKSTHDHPWNTDRRLDVKTCACWLRIHHFGYNGLRGRNATVENLQPTSDGNALKTSVDGQKRPQLALQRNDKIPEILK